MDTTPPSDLGLGPPPPLDPDPITEPTGDANKEEHVEEEEHAEEAMLETGQEVYDRENEDKDSKD
eukprot:2393930-Ditylum_brightwellii.AAC.1